MCLPEPLPPMDGFMAFTSTTSVAAASRMRAHTCTHDGEPDGRPPSTCGVRLRLCIGTARPTALAAAPGASARVLKRAPGTRAASLSHPKTRPCSACGRRGGPAWYAAAHACLRACGSVQRSGQWARARAAAVWGPCAATADSVGLRADIQQPPLSWAAVPACMWPGPCTVQTPHCPRALPAVVESSGSVRRWGDTEMRPQRPHAACCMLPVRSPATSSLAG